MVRSDGSFFGSSFSGYRGEIVANMIPLQDWFRARARARARDRDRDRDRVLGRRE